MKSRILHGSVWHMRTRPRYFFRYGVFYLDLALDEVNDVARRVRLFSHNRPNVISFRDRDYLALSAGEGRVHSVGDRPSGVSLLTHPRVLGYAFNPVSFFIYRDETETVRRVQAEVHNTWGERHVYDLAPVSRAKTYVAGTEKRFYVSPFADIEGRYAFRLREQEGRLRIRIDECRPDETEPFFRAGMDLRPLPLTDASLALMLARYPAVTFKTVAAIHWQGLKLWLRGEPFRPNPSRSSPATQAPSASGGSRAR